MILVLTSTIRTSCRLGVLELLLDVLHDVVALLAFEGTHD
jgi:hypothetical protein